MTVEDLVQEFASIFERDSVSPDTDLRLGLGIDEDSMVEILLGIEEKFDISFDIDLSRYYGDQWKEWRLPSFFKPRAAAAQKLLHVLTISELNASIRRK